jgi:segregation and condensation protein A
MATASDAATAGATMNQVPPPLRAMTGVRIAPGARPEHAAHVQLDAFDGPLALLLALIEQRQLDVLQVPLGEVAAAYLEALAGLSHHHLPHISAFVSVASQLILIKSRALLPRPPLVAAGPDEGIDPEEALRARLLVYRRFRDAAARLAERMATGAALFHREPSTAAAAALAGARPPADPPLDPLLLVAALSESIRIALPADAPPEVMTRIITLEERAQVILAALRDAPQFVLQELLSGVSDRVIIAVTFLAMLELVKGHEVVVEQQTPWGPISCRRLRPDERLVAIPVGAPDGGGTA